MPASVTTLGREKIIKIPKSHFFNIYVIHFLIRAAISRKKSSLLSRGEEDVESEFPSKYFSLLTKKKKEMGKQYSGKTQHNTVCVF